MEPASVSHGPQATRTGRPCAFRGSCRTDETLVEAVGRACCARPWSGMVHAMNARVIRGKRDREARRDQRKRDKADRLRRNRAHSADEPSGGGEDQSIEASTQASLPPVELAEVVIGVAQRPKREPLTPAKLFVGGLGWDITPEELRGAFSNFGNVTDVQILRDRATGRSRGFGFVTFEKHADADQAIKHMDGRELDGRSIKVNRAERM